jgi:hypothetical protein
VIGGTGAAIGAPGNPFGTFGATTDGPYGFGVGVGLVDVIAKMRVYILNALINLINELLS